MINFYSIIYIHNISHMSQQYFPWWCILIFLIIIVVFVATVFILNYRIQRIVHNVMVFFNVLQFHIRPSPTEPGQPASRSIILFLESTIAKISSNLKAFTLYIEAVKGFAIEISFSIVTRPLDVYMRAINCPNDSRNACLQSPIVHVLHRFLGTWKTNICCPHVKNDLFWHVMDAFRDGRASNTE